MTRDERKRFDSITAMLENYQEVIVPQLFRKIDELKDVVSQLTLERAELKAENERLRLEMSYMKSPNEIGDRHEMGSW